MNINGAIAAKVAKVLELLGIPWPGGDPETLRALAGQWRSMAATLHTTGQQLDTAVGSVVSCVSTGAAAEAFHAHWRQQREAFELSAVNFDKVATQLDAYAVQADQIVQEIVEIALEIAEMELAGAALTVLTAGISDAVSAAASGERALKIVKLVNEFIKMAERAAEALEDFQKWAKDTNKIIEILAKILVDGAKNTAMNFMGTELTDAMTGSRSQGVGADLKDAAFAGFGAAGAGVGLQGLGKGASALVGNGAHAAPSRISSALDGFGKLFDGREGEAAEALTPGQRLAGQALSGGLTSAAGQSLDDGLDGKDGADNAHDSVVSGLTGALGAGQVQHAKDAAGAHAKDPTADTNWYNITRNGRTYGEGGAANSVLTTPPSQGAPGSDSQNAGDEGAVALP